MCYFYKKYREVKKKEREFNLILTFPFSFKGLTNNYSFCEKSRKKNRERAIMILKRYLN